MRSRPWVESRPPETPSLGRPIAAQARRLDPTLHHIPVIVHTTSDTDEDILRRYQHQAVKQINYVCATSCDYPAGDGRMTMKACW